MTRTAGRLLAGAAAFLLLSFAALAADATDPIPVPKLTGRVVDLTGTLDAPERDAIAAKLGAFEKRKGAQVAVLLVPTLGTETIEEFATRVTDEWKLGRAGVDDGVLFVIARQDRRMRIQTGRGVQGVLTDALSKRIVAERVAPRFRAGDFAGGIDAGVEAILKAIDGEALPAPASDGSKGDGLIDFIEDPEAVFIVLAVFGMFLRALLGRFLGALATSGVAGFVAWLLFGGVVMAVIVAVIAFFVVLFMGTSGLRVAGSGGTWSSSPGGGWSSGGGGFSGGGGGFDGGGASGKW